MEDVSFFVLIGTTGSGKTRLLRSLRTRGFQVLDLENIAGHNGSAFGGQLRKSHSISQKEFRDILLLELALFNTNLPIITEWKGKNLGSLKIPDFIYSRQITAPKILIARNKKYRIIELMKVYKYLQVEDLYQALFSLRPKFEEEDFLLALAALKERNKPKFVAIMLNYYDSSAAYRQSQNNIAFKIEWQQQSIDEISGELGRFISKRYGS